MKDAWYSGNPYEYFMGRWSRLVAGAFVDWLAPEAGLRWLDVGCGSGALSETIVDRCDPASVVAIDQSEGFLRTVQERLGARVTCRVGDACALPIGDASADMAVSGLVLNFLPEPDRALAEMRRVTADGGGVAVYVWDYAGRMEFLSVFWDVAAELDPAASALQEKVRFADFGADELAAALVRSGFADVEAKAIDIETRFAHFDDYWMPFLGGQGPAPTYVASLSVSDRDRLRGALKARLPARPDGSIGLSARAWAVKGARRP